MYVWKVMGANLPSLYIRADSLEEAIELARDYDRRYIVGRLWGIADKSWFGEERVVRWVF